jgi:hypothetical protein
MASIVKVIEVIAQSEKGFDDAVRNAVREVSKTVSDVKTVWVDNLSCTVEKGAIVEFRANVRVSFLVQENR